MALNDTLVRAAKPQEKDYKINDGRGLYLQVSKAGGKHWRMKYRIHGKEKKLSFGSYPDVTLARARRLCNEARLEIADGFDPALEKRKAKATARLNADNIFERIAREYIDQKMAGEGRADRTIEKANWFLERLRVRSFFLLDAVGE
jgi:hypothetical protein